MEVYSVPVTIAPSQLCACSDKLLPVSCGGGNASDKLAVKSPPVSCGGGSRQSESLSRPGLKASQPVLGVGYEVGATGDTCPKRMRVRLPHRFLHRHPVGCQIGLRPAGSSCASRRPALVRQETAGPCGDLKAARWGAAPLDGCGRARSPRRQQLIKNSNSDSLESSNHQRRRAPSPRHRAGPRPP